MIKNGAGYSGVPTTETTAVCNSSVKNNSAIFRLNTKNTSFGNVTVSTDFKTIKHGGGGSPNKVYDGVHLWLRYQSEYSLYIVTISRWDGVIAIKKKVPAQIGQCAVTANDGCYYDLATQVKRPDLMVPLVWHNAVATIYDDTVGVPHISLKIDGYIVMTATDTNIIDAAYHSGAVGIRGDNTEFFFKNFLVRSY